MQIVVHPLNWSLLETVPKDDIEAMAIVRSLRRASASLDGVADSLSNILHASVGLKRGRVHAGPGRASSDAVGVLVSFADEASITRAVLVVIEGALAATLTAKALRQRAPVITDAARSPRAELAGATAAVLLASLRGSTKVALRIVAAGPAPALEKDLASIHTGSELATVHVTVTIDGVSFASHVSIPKSTARRIAAVPFEKAHLAKMGALPLALPLVLGTVEMARQELHMLTPGDAVILPGLPLRTAAQGTLSGPVSLLQPLAETGIAAELAEPARLVVRGRIARPWDSGPSSSARPSVSGLLPSVAMSDAPRSSLHDVLEDAPVVVRVEIGAVELSAREWSDVAEGDVIPLQRKLGAEATLRVAGVDVATGELVQVNGEYAVRILTVRGAST